MKALNSKDQAWMVLFVPQEAAGIISHSNYTTHFTKYLIFLHIIL